MAMRAVPSRGFTLIEMLVVLAILLVLMGLLFPVIGGARERANKTRCLGNLRQIAIAVQIQFNELGMELPYRGPNCLDWGQAAADLLPYLKNTAETFDCPSNPGIASTAGQNTEIPTHPGKYTEYELNGFIARCGAPGSLEDQRKQSGIIKYSRVAYAYDYPYDFGQPKRAHDGGVNCAYLDGHAAWLADADMGPLTAGDTNNFFNVGHRFDGDNY
jgi:prepilin-type N-terminal cleavage/methylation domain-containing protein/prepilin-type processing-associated H-X9-DG protein